MIGLHNFKNTESWEDKAGTVVCLRGGERGTCFGPPIFGGPPFKFYVRKFSLFLMKNFFSLINCTKKQIIHEYSAFKGAPTATAI